jgi:hypothetical protein
MSMENEQDNIEAAMDKVASEMTLTRKVRVGDDDEPSQVQVIIRTGGQERERYKEAAEKSGMSMSEWIRSIANKEAALILDCQHPMEFRKSYPWSESCKKCGKRLR